MFTSAAILSILPETLILVLGVALLIIDPFLKGAAPPEPWVG